MPPRTIVVPVIPGSAREDAVAPAASAPGWGGGGGGRPRRAPAAEDEHGEDGSGAAHGDGRYWRSSR